jgi:DNA-binding CsgD family transcriptional regulator
LGISPETVRKHLENAYEKLGVHTRTGAVAALFDLELDTL